MGFVAKTQFLCCLVTLCWAKLYHFRWGKTPTHLNSTFAKKSIGKPGMLMGGWVEERNTASPSLPLSTNPLLHLNNQIFSKTFLE